MRDSNIVISDATPIIALTLIDKLILLSKLYGRVIIPFIVESKGKGIYTEHQAVAQRIGR